MVKFADEIAWDKMDWSSRIYIQSKEGPQFLIRKIAGLLLLKEMFHQSDESVVERWIENAYWQYFTAEEFFQIKQPLTQAKSKIHRIPK